MSKIRVLVGTKKGAFRKRRVTERIRGARQARQGVDAVLARPGGLSYLEIPAHDARQSAAFYEKVLGWSLSEDDNQHLKFSDPSGHLIGRWVIGRAISREPGLLPFIYVNRIRAVVKKAVLAGGEMIKAPYAEGTLLVAVVRDPAGNVLGLWQNTGR
jgi:uncharacterized protein